MSDSAAPSCEDTPSGWYAHRAFKWSVPPASSESSWQFAAVACSLVCRLLALKRYAKHHPSRPVPRLRSRAASANVRSRRLHERGARRRPEAADAHAAHAACRGGVAGQRDVHGPHGVLPTQSLGGVCGPWPRRASPAPCARCPDRRCRLRHRLDGVCSLLAARARQRGRAAGSEQPDTAAGGCGQRAQRCGIRL